MRIPTPVLAGICLIASAVGVFGAGATLRVRADAWMPFNGVPGDERPGYVVEMATRIFGKRHITIDYQTMPWEDALKAARAGDIEAVIGANLVEAAELVTPAEAVGEPTMALFTGKDFDWSYSTIASLKNVRLGVVAGYSYWDALDAYIAANPGSHIVVFSGEHALDDGLKALQSQKIDVIAESIAVFVWNIKKAGRSMADFHLAYKHEGEPIYVAFAKTEDGKRFAGIFDEGVRELRKSGELAKLLHNYGLKDWNDAR